MKILIRILFITIFVANSCTIPRFNHKGCNRSTDLEHISWIVDDSCFHADVSSYESHRVEIIESKQVHGTSYIYVKSNEKLFQVIPISLGSTAINDTNIRCFKIFNKKASTTKDNIIQLKLIPIFPEERMPGDLVNSVYLNGYLLNVQRRAATNVYWGIEDS